MDITSKTSESIKKFTKYVDGKRKIGSQSERPGFQKINDKLVKVSGYQNFDLRSTGNVIMAKEQRLKTDTIVNILGYFKKEFENIKGEGEGKGKVEEGEGKITYTELGCSNAAIALSLSNNDLIIGLL